VLRQHRGTNPGQLVFGVGGRLSAFPALIGGPGVSISACVLSSGSLWRAYLHFREVSLKVKDSGGRSDEKKKPRGELTFRKTPAGP